MAEWEKAPGNINLEHYASPCPVNKFRNGDFYDVIGNVWQWTETPITGFSGFHVNTDSKAINVCFFIFTKVLGKGYNLMWVNILLNTLFNLLNN